MTQEEFTDKFERAVLGAMDRCMNELVHGDAEPQPYRIIGDTFIRPQDAGWRDQDLPVLLPAVRKHAEVLWERYDLPKLVADRARINA